ncbi:MAG: putative baseplate assembly protein [Leptolyngbyaceae cyanobacterium MO_188.B28]|nr:putative baseplate assembly protein [Leptolyngbyaceae cyanobacterium MO_188.B28]
MKFDFLPNLPKSDLDDRTFKDLVDECMLRIPRYCPEWTNHNPADPGVTLIELFAWLTDQMLLRFNQVPRANYVAFLELLGIQLQPPAPAHTEVTFYLSRGQSAQERIPDIPAGTEVATERTEGEDAVIFSTDRSLAIGIPNILHFLTAEQTEQTPQRLRDRLSNLWTEEDDGRWAGPAQSTFQAFPQAGNCFYLVLDPTEPLDGNVIVLEVEGEAAGSTGINPDDPPLRWEAWDGVAWRPILLQPSDDGSRGFSFDDGSQGVQLGICQAEITLHLPIHWPSAYFSNYRGRWLRCTCLRSGGEDQIGYSRSPQLTAVRARSIGGATPVSQCQSVQLELLGDSTGKPGQSFQLHNGSILPRQEGEHLIVTSPISLQEEVWREVPDFSDSGPNDRHYTLDSITGEIQFGPLIQEAAKLKEETQFRRQIQQQGAPLTQDDIPKLERLERQYGAVPPKGSIIRMAAYRTGGGKRGNVQKQALRVLKSAVPYVSRIANHRPAINGADAESLEEAVIRVPSFLRTRERAVTPEDFETLAYQSSRAVARAYCPKKQTEAGTVLLLLAPRTDTSGIDAGEGLAPERFVLSSQLRKDVLSYLDDRRLLGIEVKLDEPAYVGVSVQAEVGIDPQQYGTLQAQRALTQRLETELYRFLNPLTGGGDNKGWPFGAPLYKSDIIGLLQQTPGVRYLGAVELFALFRDDDRWNRMLVTEGEIDPGPSGLICSWADPDPNLRSAHAISLRY